MKSKNAILTLLMIFLSSIMCTAQITSVANGNWTSPSTWGSIPPTPGTGVIINHSVTLDINYGFTSGSITINAAGSLLGNDPNRSLALIAGGMGTITNHGIINIARMAIMSGSLTNNGAIISDSLFISTIFDNNTGATCTATQLMNSTGGSFTNNGTINGTNFLNIATATNNNLINVNDFMNCKTFTNASTGTINVAHDFLNADSLASPAMFTNNGAVKVMNDWMNTEGINGTGGRFCIANNTTNTGLLTGNIDFCDQTGSQPDINTGTIGPNITYCQLPCDVEGLAEIAQVSSIIFPNPSTGIFYIENTDALMHLKLWNALGKLLIDKDIDTEQAIDVSDFGKGMYLYSLYGETLKIKSGKIIIY